MDHKRKQISSIIRRFLSGDVAPYEWDDFISIPQAEKELEQIRISCLDIPEDYPPIDRTHYCSLEGLQKLESLAESLETSD